VGQAPRARQGAAIIHVHGGWFQLGKCPIFRNFVGHVALSAGADAFIPDYRLAPSILSAAVVDVEACYRGLADMGITKIAITGRLCWRQPGSGSSVNCIRSNFQIIPPFR